MKKREFKEIPEKNKILTLLSLVNLSLGEWNAKTPNWRTDYIGIAIQYGKSMGIKKEDFDLIKDLTIQEISDIITKK